MKTSFLREEKEREAHGHTEEKSKSRIADDPAQRAANYRRTSGDMEFPWAPNAIIPPD
jgi:hypothetical protein